MARGVKTGGRQQGSCNKITKDLRSILEEVLTKEISNIPAQLKKVEPKERLEILVKLLPYALPRYDQVSINDKPATNDSNRFFWMVNQALIITKK